MQQVYPVTHLKSHGERHHQMSQKTHGLEPWLRPGANVKKALQELGANICETNGNISSLSKETEAIKKYQREF